jgi:hypothetical protein
MNRLKKIILEEIEANTKYQFLGVCDRVRCASNQNENWWHEMIRNKRKISDNEFIMNVNMSQMLDDDELPQQWVKDKHKEDPEASAYSSNWGNKNAMFFQVAGFEFIYTK